MNNLVVVGGAGHLARALHRAAPKAQLLDRHALNVTDPRSISDALDRWKPNVVINTAAIADVDLCQANPELANQVNAFGAQTLAQKCVERGIGLIHTSTDYVFGSADIIEPFQEDAEHCPFNSYGRSKALGEILVRQAHPMACIARVSWLFGHSEDFVQTMIRRALSGEDLMVVRQIASPTPLGAVADRYIRLAQSISEGQPVPAVLNIAGSPPASRLQWLEAALLPYRQANNAFAPVLIESIERPTHRPTFSALSTSLADRYFGQSICWRAQATNFSQFPI